MDSVKISVVTVCYNAVDIIEKTILSVINQTYNNVEYIIIDGASTDGTLEILNKYRDEISIVVSEPDKGIYDAMNKGIDIATGEWINFMNAGDVFYNFEVITNVVRNIDDNADAVFGDVAITIDNVKYREKAIPFYEHLPLHHSMGFNHQATFVKTKVARRLKFNLSYKFASDYNMIITIYRQGGIFQQLQDTIIAIYDIGGVSARNYREHMFEMLMIDKPSSFLNYVKSYIMGSKRQLRKLAKYIIMKVYPQYIIKRRLLYFGQLE